MRTRALHDPRLLPSGSARPRSRVLGERACAYLLIEPGAEPSTVASLATFLTGLGLARYKLPERVETVREFPLSNVGEVSKKALREDIERKMAADARG